MKNLTLISISNNRISKAVFILLFTLVSGTAIFASTIKSNSVTGNWSDASTWDGGVVPTSADDVTIIKNSFITVNGNYTCKKLTFTNANSSSVITISPLKSLTVTGELTMSNVRGNKHDDSCDIKVMSTGTLTCGLLTMTAGNNGGEDNIEIAGTVNILSTFDGNGDVCIFTLTGTGKLNFGGSLTGTVPTFDYVASGSTVTYPPTTSTIVPGTYGNLTLSGSGVKTLTGVTVNGILSMEGTATASVAPTYGTSATLQYNTTTPRTAGVEWITPFTATGGIVIANTGTITLSDSRVVNSTLTLSGGDLAIGAHTLTLNGGFSGSSANSLIANGTSSNLTISGSGTIGNLYFDQTTPGTTNRLQNLVINRNAQTITLGNTLQIKGTITPTAGTLASAGNLVLISNALATASVSAIGASADITGNVTVQRYVPVSTRRYRMLSSPTSGFTYSQLKDNMYFTGPGGITNGFDASPTNTYTAYTYQQTTVGGRGWKGVGNITNTAVAGQGLYVFTRGDRTLPSPAWYTAPFPAQNAVTLDYNGPLNKGTISPAITYTSTGVSTDDGWNLVGNPYASPVSWTLLTKSHLASFYYTYNPTTGSYVSDNGSTLIAPGQAFFVQANAASPTISFTEAAKASGTGTGYFKTANTKISMTMTKDSVNSDIAWIEFDGAASVNYNEQEDAVKYYNSMINFGVLLNNDTVEVQYNTTSPLSNNSDTFRLFTYAATGSYKLSFGDLNTVNSSKQVLLIDAFTGKITDLKVTPEYAFGITNDPASSSKGRFQIVFTTPSGSLPVTMLSFNAKKSSNKKDIELAWSTASEHNSAKFIVQRSVAGNENFQEIGTVKTNGNSTTTKNYSYNDKDAQTILESNKVIYYRLKQVDNDGTATYTNEVAVRAENSTIIVSAYPNPTKGLMTITIPANKGNVCTAEFYDITGKVCRKATVNNNEQMDISDLQTGVYMMKITTTAGESTFVKIVKE